MLYKIAGLASLAAAAAALQFPVPVTLGLAAGVICTLAFKRAKAGGVKPSAGMPDIPPTWVHSSAQSEVKPAQVESPGEAFWKTLQEQPAFVRKQVADGTVVTKVEDLARKVDELLNTASSKPPRKSRKKDQSAAQPQGDFSPAAFAAITPTNNTPMPSTPDWPM